MSECFAAGTSWWSDPSARMGFITGISFIVGHLVGVYLHRHRTKRRIEA